MKTAFKEIGTLLDDPFFEIRHFGKAAIKGRTFPVDTYGDAPARFQFIGWTAQNDHETIQYAFHDTEIGRLMLASTSRGVCFLGFACKGDAESKADFMRRFPKHAVCEEESEFQTQAAAYCNGNHELTIPLHLKGTGFQLGIWQQLVRIPEGRLSTYGSLAPNAGGAQAIGMAVGANPVSYIIPCHRIVKNDGTIQGYHWGTELKKQLLAYEFQGDWRAM